MKVDNKIVLSDIGVTYRTIEFTDKAINKLKIISTKKNSKNIGAPTRRLAPTQKRSKKIRSF